MQHLYSRAPIDYHAGDFRELRVDDAVTPDIQIGDEIALLAESAHVSSSRRKHHKAKVQAGKRARQRHGLKHGSQPQHATAGKLRAAGHAHPSKGHKH